MQVTIYTNKIIISIKNVIKPPKNQEPFHRYEIANEILNKISERRILCREHNRLINPRTKIFLITLQIRN